MTRRHALLASVALLGFLPTAAAAQSYGVVAGPADAVQLQPRSENSKEHGGFLVGAWAGVRTPAPWLSVTVEGLFVRRGGRYELSSGLDGQIDVDYVSVAVLPTAGLRVGPVELLAYAGPAVEIHAQSRAAIELQAPFRDASGQVLAALAGGGLAFHRGRATLRLEARVSEQVTSAFSGGARDVRHRSTEVVFRVGMRPGP